jgi:hypothetical protein
MTSNPRVFENFFFRTQVLSKNYQGFNKASWSNGP